VLTTTMIHHQHYFPVVGDDGKLKPAFLAVTNMQPEKPEIIARNSERVLTARLRDARFFWDEDRSSALESKLDRLSTILFHKKLGSYREKADRVSQLAAMIARDALQRPEAVPDAEQAGRLCKADLATDIVRELTELQGTMGGIYAREDGLPETVWKAIYYHYLPVGVEPDAPPTRKQLGDAAVTWAAVSLADKLDSVVGMFAAGERPTGSRDPLGLRRQAQGLVRILVDLPRLTGIEAPIILKTLVDRAATPWQPSSEVRQALDTFLTERIHFLFEQRGFDIRAVRAVVKAGLDVDLVQVREKLEALVQLAGSAELQGVAALFKRVKNITKDVARGGDIPAGVLKEPAETALAEALVQRQATISAAVGRRDYRAAFATIGAMRPAVTTFFDDVLVMAEDAQLRAARLQLVARLRDVVLDIADISEIATGD